MNERQRLVFNHQIQSFITLAKKAAEADKEWERESENNAFLDRAICPNRYNSPSLFVYMQLLGRVANIRSQLIKMRLSHVLQLEVKEYLRNQLFYQVRTQARFLTLRYNGFKAISLFWILLEKESKL
jgi:hypothetical protein